MKEVKIEEIKGRIAELIKECNQMSRVTNKGIRLSHTSVPGCLTGLALWGGFGLHTSDIYQPSRSIHAAIAGGVSLASGVSSIAADFLDTRSKKNMILKNLKDLQNVIDNSGDPEILQNTGLQRSLICLQAYNSQPKPKSYQAQYGTFFAAFTSLITSFVVLSLMVYQICKAFRNGEAGHQHNPEFTMLEWYRPGFDHHQLMQEADELLQTLLNCSTASKISYQQLFQQYLSIDPLNASNAELQQLILDKDINIAVENLDKDTCLQILLSQLIEPQLGIEQPLFLYDFPSTQAALAKIRSGNPPVAERFEIYINGTEIANGFHELTNADEQQQRFAQDQQKRKNNNQTVPNIDQRLLDALQHGLPSCAGIVIGLDRLFMQIIQEEDICNSIAFPWDRA